MAKISQQHVTCSQILKGIFPQKLTGLYEILFCEVLKYQKQWGIVWLQ
jgi:hypothetical protein